MCIRRLRRRSHPSREACDVAIVANKFKRQGRIPFHLEQERFCSSQCESIGRNLTKNPHESQFRDRTSRQFREVLRFDPGNHRFVKLMMKVAKSDKRVHVEQVFHGKSAKSSATCLLVRTGALGPALKTGKPVAGSLIIFPLIRRFVAGIKTIRPASVFPSSESPGSIPRRRRTGPGRTT